MLATLPISTTIRAAARPWPPQTSVTAWHASAATGDPGCADAQPVQNPRVLIVSDSTLVAQGLARMLTLNGFANTQLSVDHATAERLASDYAPALLLTETGNVASATPLLHRLRDAAAEAALVVVAHPTAESFLAALRAGARGFVGRDATAAHLATALRVVAAGGWALPRARTGDLVGAYQALVQRERASQQRVSERDLRVLRLLSDGLGAGRIGAELYLSESAVRASISTLVRSLGVSNRVQLVAEACRRGLIPAA